MSRLTTKSDTLIEGHAPGVDQDVRGGGRNDGWGRLGLGSRVRADSGKPEGAGDRQGAYETM